MVDIQMDMLKSQDELDGAPVSRAHGVSKWYKYVKFCLMAFLF